jgi:hypothetical protein
MTNFVELLTIFTMIKNVASNFFSSRKNFKKETWRCDTVSCRSILKYLTCSEAFDFDRYSSPYICYCSTEKSCCYVSHFFSKFLTYTNENTSFVKFKPCFSMLKSSLILKINIKFTISVTNYIEKSIQIYQIRKQNCLKKLINEVSRYVDKQHYPFVSIWENSFGNFQLEYMNSNDDWNK